jgi:hypothetical protein
MYWKPVLKTKKVSFLTELPICIPSKSGDKWAFAYQQNLVFNKELKKAQLSVVNR